MSKNQVATVAVSFLTDRDLAARLNVSRSFVWKLHSQGRLPMPIKLGRACRWRLSDVETWERGGCPARDSAAYQEAMREVAGHE
jgi:excisionase family DNA binding protein